MLDRVRRRFVSQHHLDKGVALKVVVDPPPTHWRFAPALALIAIVFLLALQVILPATHIRHMADPHRNWIPIHQLNAHTYEKNTSDIDEMGFTFEVGKGALIIVMTKETDLRPLFVVINSTISNAKEPEKLHFCVILPSRLRESECLKLKAVFPNLEVDIVRDGFIIERMKSFMTTESTLDQNSKLMDVVPFYLPKLFRSFERFVYLESDAVLQGDIEELIQLDMEGNPVAGVEDCTQEFENIFSLDLLEAARLSSGIEKPSLPAQPYEPKTCLFDRSTLVIDPKAWRDETVTEAVHWWIAMYHRTAESLYSNGHMGLPFQLALYQKYSRLEALWSVRGSMTYAKARAAKLIHFDKQHKPWHQTKPSNFEKDVTGLWWKYISRATNVVFSTQD